MGSRRASVGPRIHTYVIDHDLGFAPNPFHGFCTLACCKPDIRKHAKEGDLVLGTGSAPHGTAGHMCYWMRVDGILTFDEYWSDPRFRRKRPELRGTLPTLYGDNIYHHNQQTGDWVQEDSFHSLSAGELQVKNLHRDTFKTDRVLVGRDFCYWGGSEPPRIPEHLRCFVHTTQGHKNHFSDAEKSALMSWLGTLHRRGRVGDPADWPTT
jgi:hypothetical protein